MVMSDNICFPAKLVHSHIQNLIDCKVDRIFMPFVVFEGIDKQQQNSYNCPIVSGYSQVIKSVQTGNLPIDSPVITFKEKDLLYKQCHDYLKQLGVSEHILKKAFNRALEAQDSFEKAIVDYNKQIIEEGKRKQQLIILLAGRPYHADPLVQHKISNMISAMGVHVITDDIVQPPRHPSGRSELPGSMGIYQPYSEISKMGYTTGKPCAIYAANFFWMWAGCFPDR